MRPRVFHMLWVGALSAPLMGCANDSKATIERATGAFASWSGGNCVCLFSKGGSQGTTHDSVSVICSGYKPPAFADMSVDVKISVAGERLYAYGSATGSLPSSGHPFTVGGVTDSVAGDFEPVGMNRHQIPVHIIRAELPAQHQCDAFTVGHEECVDFPGGSLFNLSNFCSVLGDDWK